MNPNFTLLAALIGMRVFAILLNISVIRKQLITWNWKADRTTTNLKRLLFSLTVIILLSNILPLTISTRVVLGDISGLTIGIENIFYLMITAGDDVVQSVFIWVIYRGAINDRCK